MKKNCKKNKAFLNPIKNEDSVKQAIEKFQEQFDETQVKVLDTSKKVIDYYWKNSQPLCFYKKTFRLDVFGMT